MSIGMFLGFRATLDPDDASSELASIAKAMRQSGLDTYDERRDSDTARSLYEDLHEQARSGLDHTGAGSLASFGKSHVLLWAKTRGRYERLRNPWICA